MLSIAPGPIYTKGAFDRLDPTGQFQKQLINSFMENFSNPIGHSLEYCFSNNVRTAINFPLAGQRETV